MNNIKKFFFYYVLIIFGLTITSWIIWSRFIRERTIRDVPDGLFTEYRFWILLYICCIYLYIITNYTRPKEPNRFSIWLSEMLLMPQKALDHMIKYNVYNEKTYYTMIDKVLDFIARSNEKQLLVVFYLFEILPRVILVFFLLMDTFYFNTIELFYKVVLIGLIPFLFKYFLYCIKDIYDHWVALLENKYGFVFIYEKGYEALFSRKHETKAEHHCQRATIKEYIEIKYFNMLQNEFEENFPYEYVASIYCKEETYIDYTLKKYDNIDATLSQEDYTELECLFTELIPKILECKIIIDFINRIKKHHNLKWSKIVIFSLYFICWFFILFVNYYVYPVELHMLKYFCGNLILYLCMLDDPFTMLYGYSLNENYLTVEKLKHIYEHIKRKIFHV